MSEQPKKEPRRIEIVSLVVRIAALVWMVIHDGSC